MVQPKCVINEDPRATIARADTSDVGRAGFLAPSLATAEMAESGVHSEHECTITGRTVIVSVGAQIGSHTITGRTVSLCWGAAPQSLVVQS